MRTLPIFTIFGSTILKPFAEDKNHTINRIKNFWNQPKRHLHHFNGISKAHIVLLRREDEERCNCRHTKIKLKHPPR